MKKLSFTLVEFLEVIFIISLLAGTVFTVNICYLTGKMALRMIAV